jgi:hypothetical protein
MASRTSKIKVILRGGPYSGYPVKLSASKLFSHNQWMAYPATFVFTAKGQTGSYINGKWKECYNNVPLEDNPNIVLGDM